MPDEPEPTAVDPSAAHWAARRLQARSATLRCTLAALGAWIITVLPLGVSGRASALGRVLALLALVPGLVGPQLIGKNHKLARHVGITAFLAAALAAWAWASKDGILTTMDAFRSLLGVLAWGVFAVSWAHPWSVGEAQLRRAPEGETSGLRPRRRPPVYAVAVAVAGALGALGCLALAWRVEDPTRAVLAQAVAAGCAVALVTAAATVAVAAGRETSRDGTTRLPIDRRVVNTVVAMLVVGALAAAVRLSMRP
jgi:hypothetical protein